MNTNTLRSFCLHACHIASVVSDSLRPYGLQPARLLCPWDSPGKNAGVGCHALLQGIFPTQGSNPSLTSPALAGRLFTTSLTWEALRAFETKSTREVIRLSQTLCDPTDGSLPRSSVYGMFQATVLEWAAISFSELQRRINEDIIFSFSFQISF